MSEIELNEVALAAAKGAAREQWSRFEEMPAWIIEVGIRAYLSSDPDRAARDAVVEAARNWNEKYNAWMATRPSDPLIVRISNAETDAQKRLRAAVAALAKEGE